MRTTSDDAELERGFRAAASTSLPRAPLNAALCAAIADDPSLRGLLGHAPVRQRTPMLLLAALHDLVLAEPDHPLAAWYADVVEVARDPGDPALAPTLRAFVDEREPALLDLLATRHVQTNEVGRCALLVAALAGLDLGPVGLVDVGTSAGLNLQLARYAYRFDDGPLLGRSEVELACSTRGDGPAVTSIPDVVTAVGIDARPVDPSDPSDARWLRACCWPDQADRARRLAAAIDLARRHPPTVVAGDAVESIGPVVDGLPGDVHPVVTTTWVASYLGASGRRALLDELDRLGAGRDLTWVFAESPAQTPELPHADDLAGEELTALVRATWRGGRRHVEHLATCHPHGYWIRWR